ncbi:hypothetical protein LZS85_15635 [Aliivibrio fischeri]|uniref:hypothetical protein n=1 Tax=Aliivibrio fischeri TaxID=668 RepID=UPI001F30DF44|nr:hypothetical protein [Aliivibrio fischeri]MCE7567555.1 hypothetical protein [Aliivibrio fischeri]
MSVIDFERRPQFKNGEKEIQRYVCPHITIALDHHRRLLVCEDCNQHMDPFDFLIRVSKKEIRIRDEITFLSKQCKILHEEVAELRRTSQNLKATIRRDRRKIDD